MLKVLKFLGLGLIVLLAAFTMFMMTGQIPDSKAVTGAKLPGSAISDLREAGIVSENEEIIYFYSEDLFSFVDYGNLYTNERVISYELDEDTGERNIYTAKYDIITDIKMTESTSLIEDSVVEIYVNGELEFSLLVSAESNGDDRFYKKLLEKWKAKNKDI